MNFNLHPSAFILLEAADGIRTRENSLEGYCVTTTPRPQQTLTNYTSPAACGNAFFLGAAVKKQRL